MISTTPEAADRVPRCFTPSALAARWSVPSATVRYWLRTGKLRGRRVGSRYLITERDAIAFLNGETQETASETTRKERT